MDSEMSGPSENFNQQQAGPGDATQDHPIREELNVCQFCGPNTYSFSSKKTLREHIRTQHKKEHKTKPEADRNAPKTFKCSVCGPESAIYATKQAVDAHKRMEHRLSCELCGATFVRKQTLQKHLDNNVCTRNRSIRNTGEPESMQSKQAPADFQSNPSQSHLSFQVSRSSQRADPEPESYQFYASQSYNDFEPSGPNQSTDQDMHLSDLTDQQFADYLQANTPAADGEPGLTDFEMQSATPSDASAPVDRPVTQPYTTDEDYKEFKRSIGL